MLDPNAVRINASTIFNYNSAIADNLTPEQIKKKFEASGLEKDRTYTFSEAKTFLKPKDFDQLLNDKAEAVLSQSEKVVYLQLEITKMKLSLHQSILNLLLKLKI